jgi:hypothetical protein
MVFWGGEIRLVASEGYHQKGGLPMTKLDMLNAQRAEKFAALCALVARDLGYGELQHLSEEDRIHIEGEAKHYVELWSEMLEIKTSPTFRSRRCQPTRIASVESCKRFLAIPQFTIWRGAASTLPVTKESAMNAVPIVRAMPTMIPNKKFMSGRPFSHFPVFFNAQEERGVPFGVGTTTSRALLGLGEMARRRRHR